MRCRHAPFTLALCISLAFGAGFQPVNAAGLISTEQVALGVPAGSLRGPSNDRSAIGRAVLLAALVQAGVEPDHAQARLAALTDTEIAELGERFETAPAGGVWFAPFLLVAMVIGALIGVRSQSADASSTDLFGRARSVAATP